ncbi:uncharacterized protein E0L32_001211 [Thyridium curvatum]|uniref:3'-5' exonuclease domain-containing protein n=1 Tax=Thyridium curvatum TaxID=1093900 RepID=A0A507AU46_9PEZI|nr:uncharacterized protein E0L32_001211 [Thyridium curvatum]TPX10014.1 hypothetical protein E0L32_001211 [Thyridium curvatum]
MDQDARTVQDLEVITRELAKTKLDSLSSTDLIDTPKSVSTLVDVLYSQPTAPPSIFIDLEGVLLSRHGSISILQIFIQPENRTYLVDIYTLRDKAFLTPGACDNTLKDLLETDTIPKVFFDVRNDSDAMFSHFQVRLAGIQDLQLMELATRRFNRKFVNGLSKCIENDCPMTPDERSHWKEVKERGVKMFAPEKGGSYEVFNKRPLPRDIWIYCVQDVQFLPRLWSHYNARMSKTWRSRVAEASRERVITSQAPTYNGKGRQKALAPQGWAYY